MNVASLQKFRSLWCAGRLIISQEYVTTNIIRCFTTTMPNRLKEISVKTEGNKTVVEGVIIESPRKNKVLPTEEGKENLCPACPHRLGMEIKYTDVLILSQFLRSDGRMLPRYVTGLCGKAQNRMKKLVTKAQRAGLMPEYRPDRRDGQERTLLKSPYKWKKYNVYYEDDDWEP